jgi:hypothetical protein
MVAEEIRAECLKRGAQAGVLGYPISDEHATPDGRCRAWF